MNIRSYTTLLIFSLLISIISVGCNRQSEAVDNDAQGMFEAARFIKGVSNPDNSVSISIINPWDSTAILADYLLVNGEAADTAAIKGKTTLRLPLKRLIVYSSVHAALLVELGYADAIVGVADARYIKTPEILERIKDGRITDIGASTDPSLEKILTLRPDAVLLSPYQNSGHGVVDKAGVPVIECADYMETTPLGRAEWSKFYAMLVEGISDSNSQIYNASRDRYNSLKEQAAEYSDHPKVITEWQNNGTWVVPGAYSYAARLITDAGGEFPFPDLKTTGSVPMSYEKVYLGARDADFWLLRTFGKDLTLKDIEENHRFNRQFWAFVNNGIYNANTAECNIFEETPFHPDLLLSDYVAIFHHTGAPLRYFSPVN